MRETTPKPAAHLRAGQQAEERACAFLVAQGLTIVERNVRVPGGEIDIVARDGAVLVFVEVRWRRTRGFGGALASLGWRKRERMAHAAQVYLMRFRTPPACRLDALCCDGVEAPAPRSQHDAPSPSDHWHWVRGL